MSDAPFCPIVGKPIDHLELLRSIELHQRVEGRCPGCGRVLTLVYHPTGALMGFPRHREHSETAVERRARWARNERRRYHRRVAAKGTGPSTGEPPRTPVTRQEVRP